MNHDTTLKSKLISVAAIVAAGSMVFVGGMVQAAEAPQYETTVVAYGDLNLDSQQGTKLLYARLRSGAEDVCSSFEGRDVFFRRLWQSCFDQAVAAAVLRVNRPGLTTLHSQTTKK